MSADDASEQALDTDEETAALLAQMQKAGVLDAVHAAFAREVAKEDCQTPITPILKDAESDAQ